MNKKESTSGTADAYETVARGIEDAGAGAHVAIDRVSDAARPAVDRLISGAHAAVDKAAVVANQTADSLGAQGDRLMQAQDRLVQGVSGYVRANPVTSIGIAIATGFVLGRLLSTR